MMRLLKALPAIALFLLLLSACGKQSQVACAEQPVAGQVVPALLSCLDADASAVEVEGLLRDWGRIDAEWGGVTAADLLPATGDELVISYHTDLQNAMWNPQGTLVVLQRQGSAWEAAFDTSALEPPRPDGSPWDNWAYEALQTGDATGDGRDDVLLRLRYSNGTHTSFLRHAVLTAHDADEARLMFLEADLLGDYQIVTAEGDVLLQFTGANDLTTGQQAITRTYTFSGNTFTQVDEVINPALATASARLPDGSTWVTFDQASSLGSSSSDTWTGLYRLRDGALTHVPVPAPVRVLEAAPNGALYVGAGCGLLRYREGEWEQLAPIDCGSDTTIGSGPITDIAVADSDAVWVGTPFSLARYDGSWQAFEIHASRLLVTPDESVWAAGWDG
ncbi:MAG: hypothetical protein ACOCXI_13005, partial [Chloroflexota bacterium]